MLERKNVFSFSKCDCGCNYTAIETRTKVALIRVKINGAVMQNYALLCHGDGCSGGRGKAPIVVNLLAD
jgi:predicted solute-binding protein